MPNYHCNPYRNRLHLLFLQSGDFLSGLEQWHYRRNLIKTRLVWIQHTLILLVQSP